MPCFHTPVRYLKRIDHHAFLRRREKTPCGPTRRQSLTSGPSPRRMPFPRRLPRPGVRDFQWAVPRSVPRWLAPRVRTPGSSEVPRPRPASQSHCPRLLPFRLRRATSQPRTIFCRQTSRCSGRRCDCELFRRGSCPRSTDSTARKRTASVKATRLTAARRLLHGAPRDMARKRGSQAAESMDGLPTSSAASVPPQLEQEKSVPPLS